MRRQKQTYFCLAVAILLGISAFAAAQDLHISFKPLEHIPDTAPAIEIGSVSHTYVLGVLHTSSISPRSFRGGTTGDQRHLFSLSILLPSLRS